MILAMVGGAESLATTMATLVLQRKN